LLACLVALDIKTEDGRQFDSGTKTAMFKLIRNSLDSLLEQEFLEGKSRTVLVVNRNFVEILTRMVVEKVFTAMVGSIQHLLLFTEDKLKKEPALSMDQLMAGMRILFYQKKGSIPAFK